MINLNNDYWKNKKENYENENNFININTNEGKRTRTIIGIILISAVAIIGLIDTLVQNNKEERIKKINEEITRYNQNILYKNQLELQKNQEQILNQYSNSNYNNNNNYYSENNNNLIRVYSKFNGRILNYSKNNGNVTMYIMTNGYKTEYIRTSENVIQNIQNKIDNNNNFEFTCQSKRGNTLEDCTIY